MTDLERVRAIVTAWRNDTELGAARCMYELAKALGIEPPKPVAGKVRRSNDGDRHPRTAAFAWGTAEDVRAQRQAATEHPS